MSDPKSHQFRPPLYHAEAPRAPARADNGSPQIDEKKGWDAYRKWLSSVNGKPAAERIPVDHSIYSWKGYQNWADRVRETWKADEN
jgi:hypothetical protein